MSRFRAAHLGFAAAGAVMAATVLTVAPIVRANVAPPPADPASFVPITPCRLADTRPAPNLVGNRATPLGESEVVPFTVRGQNGQCNIPATATAIVSNVTAVGPSAASFVTLYPADAPQRPLASNLNLVAGGAPTPNQVTVKLSATGVINAFNRFGTVDLIIDIVGYFQPADDDGGGGGGGGDDDPIPAGTTVTGIQQAPTAGGAFPIQFPQPAPTPVTAADIGFSSAVGSPVNADCNGTVNAPTAPPGKVCIYVVPNPAAANAFTAEPLPEPTAGVLVRWVPAPVNPLNPQPIIIYAWAYTAP